jgi:hypothetical protein
LRVFCLKSGSGARSHETNETIDDITRKDSPVKPTIAKTETTNAAENPSEVCVIR